MLLIAQLAKRIISLMVVWAFSVLTCTGQGCDTPCDLGSYSASQNVDLQINGCTYTVQYRIRTTCTQGGAPLYDVYIEALFTSDPNCPTKYPNGIVDEAVSALLQTNPMGFPPTAPGEAPARWRIVRLACWSPIEEFYIGCVPSPCCETTVDVTFNLDCSKASFRPVEQVYETDCSATPGCVGECLGDIFEAP